MVLFGAHLHLRGDKIMDLGFFILMVENIICNSNVTIAGLFVQILGKTEKQISLPPMAMALWAIPTHPWLFPVKYFLLLV